MQNWQTTFLGRTDFPQALTALELAYFFSFTPDETAAIRTRKNSRLRLAAALQLGFLKMTGRPLEAVDAVPVAVMRHLSKELGFDAPDLASLKTLYSRRNTMFAHQKWAQQVAGFRPYSGRRQAPLRRYLASQAQHRETKAELMADARVWLYERKSCIPGERRLADLASDALAGVAEAHATAVSKQIPEAVRQRWEHSLLSRHDGRTRLEWLQERPKRLSLKAVDELNAKIEYLRRLGVHKYPLADIRLERQEAYARMVRRRRPSRLTDLSEKPRAVAVACFLRVTLMETTDVMLGQCDMLAARVVRRAQEDAVDFQRQATKEAFAFLATARELLHDNDLDAESLRDQLLAALPKVEDLSKSLAAETRKVMTKKAGRRIRPLLKRMLRIELSHDSKSSAGTAVKVLRGIYKTGRRTLPAGAPKDFAPGWEDLMASDDNQAMRAFEAAVLEALRNDIKRGTAWSSESFRHRSRDATLMSQADWNTGRGKHIKALGQPPTAKPLVDKLNRAIDSGLERVSAAVAEGQLTIRNGDLHLPAMKKEEDVPDAPVQSQLFKELGTVQLPKLIVQVDSMIHFSWILLGRAPRDSNELVNLYASLLALGTEMSVAAVELVVPGVTRESLTPVMVMLENASRLRRCNTAAVEFIRSHPIAETWGDGTTASADAMHLGASPHLWKVRADPRTGEPSLGIYTHLLDQWGFIYDQPIVLNQRQVGAAIEGAIRNTVTTLQMLAVDTHGYTDFGMGIAKLLGFDLCPRLKSLKHRRLYVARGTKIPENIREIVRPVVTPQQIDNQWDELLRLAVSIREGHTSAVHALARFGSASRGDSIYGAGVALGRLQRTLFLCDYFTNPDFRRELLRILNHGESVHTLQRVIHRGGVGVRRDRHDRELAAVSGALTLLTNLVMVWVTHRMQNALDRWAKDGQRLSAAELQALKHTSPAHFEGINFRGVMTFPVDEHAARLFKNPELRIA